MLKLELPFHLAEPSDGTFLRSNLIELHRQKADEVILEGLRIALETRGKTYAFTSDGPPQPDQPGRGAIWQRAYWPLSEGISIEQQMLLPAANNALAVSWRLIGGALLPIRLKVSPVFSALQPFSPTGFEIEPESNGGRSSWRPYPRSSKIIADTNGSISRKAILDPSDCIPGCFKFNMGPRPAILILCTEPHSAAKTDPMLGAFLAELSEQAATTMDCNQQPNLVAA